MATADPSHRTLAINGEPVPGYWSLAIEHLAERRGRHRFGRYIGPYHFWCEVQQQVADRPPITQVYWVRAIHVVDSHMDLVGAVPLVPVLLDSPGQEPPPWAR